MKKPLILVDGSSYLYRAFHAMPALANSKNFPTGAIYGVVNMLRRLLTEYQPEYIAVVFDDKGQTFRDVLYPQYKANRSEMPSELVQQIAMIHTVIEMLGIPIIIIPGVEADDVIGTLAKKAAQKHMTTLISTGDKDLAQLVDEHTTLVNTMTDTILDSSSVEQKFGIPPNLIVDYLTLIGDSVDNIPGVPQVGPKTAVKWLQEYGSLDNIVKHANDIKGKVGESFRAHLSQLPLAKNLATIKLDVDIDLDLEKLSRKEPNAERLIELYRELEFKSWLNDLLEKNPAPDNQQKYQDYEVIFTEKALDAWIEKLTCAEVFSFDTETTSLNYMDAKIVGVSFATAPGKAAYVPVAHDEKHSPPQLSRDFVLKKLQPLLEDPRVKKIGHHIKYDREVLANHGIDLQGIAFDSMLESYVLDSTSNNHDMDSLALKYLGWRTIHYEDVAGKGAKQIPFNQVAIAAAATYAAEDADVTLQLHHVLWPRVEQEPGLKKILTEIEIPLISVLANMERNGVLIDAEMLKKQTAELSARVHELEAQTYELAGAPFNMNSPKQLQDVLFNQMQLPVIQKTPTGQPSTAESVLQELALNYPLPKLIIEYRSLSKLITTYTDRLPQQINAQTGRVHTSYNQTGTATGRLSSSDPNLQNIPVRTQEGRRIRQAFIAAKHHKIISADYSQIELRIMAHMSSDPNLLKAFANHLDVHTATAAEVLGIPIEQVTSEQRRSAKAINFGLIYGMSAFGLAQQLGIERSAAQDYSDRYFARYPRVQEYMENTRKFAREHGFVETLWGRRLYLPEIKSSQIPRQKAAERTAINAPLQGTAADIIKTAMIHLDEWINTHPELHVKMIMQVHDELIFEVPDQHVDQVIHVVRDFMMNAISLKVPLTVDIGVGLNWDEASA